MPSQPPKWIKPQLTHLVDEPPAGADWLHEIKYDGYRMHARIDGDKIQLLTRTGLDWSHRYKRTIEAQAWLRQRGKQEPIRSPDRCPSLRGQNDRVVGTSWEE
jgi:hypothetical protein